MNLTGLKTLKIIHIQIEDILKKLNWYMLKPQGKSNKYARQEVDTLERKCQHMKTVNKRVKSKNISVNTRIKCRCIWTVYYLELKCRHMSWKCRHMKTVSKVQKVSTPDIEVSTHMDNSQTFEDWCQVSTHEFEVSTHGDSVFQLKEEGLKCRHMF